MGEVTGLKPEWRDLNTSGFTPLDMRVLVRADKVEEKTSGGLYLPEKHKERQEMAQTRATLVAVGGNAFRDWGDVPKPAPGDRVLIGRYTGGEAMHTGRDGEEYRVCNDADILAILEE